MADTEAAKPRVFLSSVFKEVIDGEWKDVPLRRRIIEGHQGLPVDLWAYDRFWSEDSETPEPGADTVIDRLVKHVSDEEK